MKHNNLQALFFFATLFISLSVLAGAEDRGLAKGHDSCANLPAAGEWGFTWTGTIIIGGTPIPAAAVGKGVFDANGDFTGTLTSSIGGTVSTDMATGTSTLNPDCTGTLTVTTMGGAVSRTATWDTVLVDDGKESRGIMKSLAIPGYPPVYPIVTMTSKQLFPERGIGK